MALERIAFHILIRIIIGLFSLSRRIYATIDILWGELSWEGVSCYKWVYVSS